MTSPRPLARREDAGEPADIDFNKPLTVREALWVSDVLAKSDLMPYSLKGKPASIFHVIMTGQALGVRWIDAPRVIYSPGPGQIGLRGQFLLSQLRKAGHTYKFEQGDDWVKFILTRGDTSEVFEGYFSIDEAIQANLVRRVDDKLVALSRDGKPLPWQLYTRRQLRWRAVADGTGIGAPEVSLGFEIEGDLPEPPQQVDLRPETPAPPGPDTGLAATGDSQAEQVEAVRAELHKLNDEMKQIIEDSPELQESRDKAANARAEGRTTPLEEVIARETEASEAAREAEEAQEKPKNPALELRARLTDMGYDPRKYRGNVQMACSVFARRKITKMTDLEPSEIAAMNAALKELAEQDTPLALVSRLADAVDKWDEAWRTEDPDGYAAYTEGMAT